MTITVKCTMAIITADGVGWGGMHGGHHKLDQTALKQFFEPLPAAIIDEKKNAALIKLALKLYLDPLIRSMIRFPVILITDWIILAV